MRTECLSSPSFPNPICSNKRLKGKEKETLLVKGGGIITYILGQHFSTCNPFTLSLSFYSDKRSQTNVIFYFFFKNQIKKKKNLHQAQRLRLSFFFPPMTTFISLNWKIENINRMKKKKHFDSSEMYRVTHLCGLLCKTFIKRNY